MGLAWIINACGSTKAGDHNSSQVLNIPQNGKVTMGTKLQLCEDTVRALQRMKCPYTLQAFHLQGLDYTTILPVTEWLVHRLLSSRKTVENGF
ncbi:hypothetical protein Pelo_16944 [Pelomyxa schiedti]|nr:hypothetical protein Pelo_16944 [Pelomyxa schiedti]